MQTSPYTIEVVAPGVHSASTTTAREHVRGYALDKAARFARIEGARLNVRRGRTFQAGPVVSSYVAVAGRWLRDFGTVIVNLEGADGADAYMHRYPLPHVTREYAEKQANW